MMAVTMKVPIDCPYCGDPFLNEFMDLPGSRSRLTKVCIRRATHTIKIRTCDENHDYIDFIRIPYSSTCNITWYMGTGRLWTDHHDGTHIVSGGELPFFLPDLTNIPKLLGKIKTYFVFS